MALTPWNRQEEWYQQMINASTGNYLPSISAQDAGKVMTVESDGSWGVENVPTELPAVETTDKDKYLHTNESTGALEWAEGGSGGGVLVVHEDDNGVLDKTWQEIANAVATTGAAIVYDDDGAIVAAYSVTCATFNKTEEKHYVIANDSIYGCASASGYPTYTN